MQRFSFDYQWERPPIDAASDYELIDLVVECTREQYIPERRYDLYGNPGWPAEGGEVEIVSVEVSGTRMKTIPDDLVLELEDFAKEHDPW